MRVGGTLVYLYWLVYDKLISLWQIDYCTLLLTCRSLLSWSLCWVNRRTKISHQKVYFLPQPGSIMPWIILTMRYSMYAHTYTCTCTYTYTCTCTVTDLPVVRGSVVKLLWMISLAWSGNSNFILSHNCSFPCPFLMHVIMILYWHFCFVTVDKCMADTVEPPYNGHLGTRHLVLYKEVVLSLEVENVLWKYEILHLGSLNLSFTRRSFYIVSFILSVHYERFHCTLCTVVSDSWFDVWLYCTICYVLVYSLHMYYTCVN